MSLKNEFFEKWDRNRDFVNEFKETAEARLNATVGWECKSFPGSDMTAREYLKALEDFSAVEYSDIQRQKLIAGGFTEQVYF